MKQKIINGKIVIICEECGEEVKSLNHKCNPFKIKQIFGDKLT